MLLVVTKVMILIVTKVMAQSVTKVARFYTAFLGEIRPEFLRKTPE
ncbi:hypothetical protein CCANI_05200 [Corynebacterium canis]|nr:hypothetical protein CCANI_05200 [Corynebacterium canis]